MTSGYRCVNYFELCRLCTSSTGEKTHIFSEEGRRKDLIGKIGDCLPVLIDEQDRLPKILCNNCLSQVEQMARFRETSINAQSMLESCLNTSKLRTGGKVYIKDVMSKKPGTSVAPTIISATPVMSKTTTIVNRQQQRIIGQTSVSSLSHSAVHQQQKHQQQQQQQQQLTVTNNNATTTTTLSSDFLSSIMQASGITSVDTDMDIFDSQPLQQHQQQQQQQQTTTTTFVQQPQQQYTITLDGQTYKSNQIHYKIEPAMNNMITTQQHQPMQQIHIQQEPQQLQVIPIQQQQTPPKPKLTQLQQRQQQLRQKQQTTFSQVNEFLKLKTNSKITIKKKHPAGKVFAKKTKSNIVYVPVSSANNNQQLVTTSPTKNPIQLHHQQLMQAGTSNQSHQLPTATIISSPNGNKQMNLQDLKIMSANKCYVPVTVKHSNGTDKQIHFMEMKINPEISTIDGQIVQLSQAGNQLTLTAAPQQQQQQLQIVQQQQQPQQQHQQVQTYRTAPSSPLSASSNNGNTTTTNSPTETKTIFTTSTGQSVTITHAPLSSLNAATATTYQQQQQQLEQNLMPPPAAVPMQIIRVKGDGGIATIEGQQMECVQLTPLQNVPQPGNVNRMLPQKSGITIQRIKTGGQRRPSVMSADIASNTAAQQLQQLSRIGSNSQPALARNVAVTGTRPPLKATARVATKGYLPAQRGRTTANAPSTTAITSPSAAAKTVNSISMTPRRPKIVRLPPPPARAKTNATTTVVKTPPKPAASPSSSTTAVAAAAIPGDTSRSDGAVETEGGMPTCHVCGKMFKRKEHLAQHIKLHLGLRPFKCDEPGCNKSFSRKEHLLRHVVSHTGQKMFNCEFCQKLFSRKDNLNKHRRAHLKSEQTDASAGVVFSEK